MNKLNILDSLTTGSSYESLKSSMKAFTKNLNSEEEPYLTGGDLKFFWRFLRYAVAKNWRLKDWKLKK